MSEKIKTKPKEETNVKGCSVIDFSTLETKMRKDDFETWNAMQLYGENDDEERSYQLPKKISQKRLREILKEAKATKVGQRVFATIVDAAQEEIYDRQSRINFDGEKIIRQKEKTELVFGFLVGDGDDGCALWRVVVNYKQYNEVDKNARR